MDGWTKKSRPLYRTYLIKKYIFNFDLILTFFVILYKHIAPKQGKITLKETKFWSSLQNSSPPYTFKGIILFLR